MSWVPTMAGTIERRLLLNYRVDLDVLERILPSQPVPSGRRGGHGWDLPHSPTSRSFIRCRTPIT
jgi:hypothetical protein